MRRLESLADLPQLVARVIELPAIGQAPLSHVGVVRIADDVFAFDPTCAHRPAPLVEGAVTWKRTLLCPWHLGTYDLTDGHRMAGPPERGIETFAVVIRDDVAYLAADHGVIGPAPRYAEHPYDAARTEGDH